jgi:chromosome segregation ATPase
MERPAPEAPQRTFLDYTASKAITKIRELRKGRAGRRIPGEVFDLAEKAYRILRNEQELAMWRARAQQIMADLLLLGEAIDAEADRAIDAEIAIMAEVAKNELRLVAIEGRYDEMWVKIDVLGKGIHDQSDEIARLKRFGEDARNLIASMNKTIQRLTLASEEANRRLANAERRLREMQVKLSQPPTTSRPSLAITQFGDWVAKWPAGD